MRLDPTCALVIKFYMSKTFGLGNQKSVTGKICSLWDLSVTGRSAS